MATPTDLPRDLGELRARVDAAVAAKRRDVVARLLIDNVRRTLKDGWERDEGENLAKLLKSHQQFGYARRLYRQLYEDAGPALKDEIRQQYALCVYKDLELPASRRYERALQILEDGGDVKGWSAESLGLAGAVYKRRWQAEAKLADLQNAHTYYAEGFTRRGDDDRLYCGVNAAFVLDQIATVDQTGRLGTAPQADALREQARKIRDEIVTELQAREGKLNMWDTATLAEALFGLERFGEARAALADYVGFEPAGWERETTASQLAELARLREFGLAQDGNRSQAAQFVDSDAATALHELVGDAEALLRRAYVGKVGLALSGGGYRASLFHIGVLARLAERDVLRGVEVLSCVSGGSILGAFYYLRVRELLQSKGDDKITADDYIELVQKLARDFVSAVQGNARVRLIGNVKDNWKMAVRTDYSRTDRVAELFQTLIYAQVKKDGADGDWRMNDLFINPSGRDGFSPRYDNWERQAKVPILVLNATTLNTGHSWQFTASWMGEPPDLLDERVDANPRLRRMYYADAPLPYRDEPPRLADAVAASACVPGLFPPIQLDGLYEGHSVQLVDGGVHDNQGVASLIEQDCAVMLVSDASGQMGERKDPGRLLLSVATRSNSILMSRVRGAQLADLAGRRRAGSLRRLMVVHLKKGLPAPPMDWGSDADPCPEPYRPELDERAAVEATSESDYGISVGVQRALADIRTDLDSFSDVEAYALMAAGYKMAGHELDKQLKDFPEVFGERPTWPFDRMLDRLAQPLPDDQELDVALVVGKERFGKPLRAWWRRRSRGPGRGRRALQGAADGIGRGARLGTLPVRAVVAAPVSLIGAAGTRVYLATLGRVRRRK